MRNEKVVKTQANTNRENIHASVAKVDSIAYAISHPCNLINYSRPYACPRPHGSAKFEG